MTHIRSLWIAAGLLVAAGSCAAAGAHSAQEPAAAAAEVKPGPEHELLKKDLGTWNAVVKIYMAPDSPPMEMTGTEVNRLDCDGLWVMTTFESPGAFSGRGINGWDAQKKKYVSVWVDSGSTTLGLSTGTYDKARNTFTYTGEQPDKESGKMIKNRSLLEYPDANTRKYTSWSTPSGGKEVKTLEILYTRSK